MVSATVSITHPRTILIVCHEQSPFRNFFTEIGSVRVGESNASHGLKTWSIAVISIFLTCSRCASSPCAMVIKSSTNTSMYPGNGNDGNEGSLPTGVCRLGSNCLVRTLVGSDDGGAVIGMAVGLMVGLVSPARDNDDIDDGVTVDGMAVGVLEG